MPSRRQRIPLLAALTVMLLTAIVALPAAANQHTTIAVYGSGPDWRPDPGYEIHMLGRSWSIVGGGRGSGNWSVEVTAPFDITVLRLDDCQPILRFTAEPGRIHAIQFEADGSVSWSMPAGADGGGLPPTPPQCSMPDTGTITGTGVGSDPQPAGLILALAAALGVLLGRRLQRGAAGSGQGG